MLKKLFKVFHKRKNAFLTFFYFPRIFLQIINVRLIFLSLRIILLAAQRFYMESTFLRARLSTICKRLMLSYVCVSVCVCACVRACVCVWRKSARCAAAAPLIARLLFLLIWKVNSSRFIGLNSFGMLSVLDLFHFFSDEVTPCRKSRFSLDSVHLWENHSINSNNLNGHVYGLSNDTSLLPLISGLECNREEYLNRCIFTLFTTISVHPSLRRCSNRCVSETAAWSTC